MMSPGTELETPGESYQEIKLQIRDLLEVSS